MNQPEPNLSIDCPLLFEVYPESQFAPIQGNGVYVYDQDGQSYLDLYGGHGVISIGHTHPHFVEKLTEQLGHLGYYSNAVQNPLQMELAEKLRNLSGCPNYQLFLCNSGAEANENALKTASFHTGKKRVVAFKGGFHGRTSAAAAVTDNAKICAPVNTGHQVTFLELGDLEGLESALKQGDVCAVIIEFIQGIGGLNESGPLFYESLNLLCKRYNALLIADEVQCGYGRSGDFFAFQHYNVEPDIITIAKGMGNGFPIGGVLIHSGISPEIGMLGSTFGGNHLACAAGIAVLDVMEQEALMENVREVSAYFFERAKDLQGLVKVKGRGLMLGLEFDFEVADLQKKLLTDHFILTGSSNNKKLLRILPPLCVGKEDVDCLFEALLGMGDG